MRARRRAAAGRASDDDDPDRPASGSAAVPAGVGAREAFTPSRYDGPRAGGAVYGGGGYRNEPPYEPERTGNVYGGGQYRGADPYAPPGDDRPAPPDRYGGPPRGYEGFTGNGYAGDGYAGRYPPGEPEYRSPAGGFYDR
jgi:hypothetical protein